MNNSVPPVALGVHGNTNYIHFEFSFYTLPMVLLFVPILYIPITIIIIMRIFMKLINAVRDQSVNAHLFLALTMSHFTCLFFFVCDFLFLRLPATGVFTSWCASIDPNAYLNILTLLTYYGNYATMLFPFLVSLMRIILIVSPQNHGSVNGVVIRIAIPFILIYPLFFIFFMFPSVGYCYQPGYPFPFGAVHIGFKNTWFGLCNNYFLLGNSLFWSCASIINNTILIIKLINLKISLSKIMRSQKSYKAEVSLTFTTCSMILSYLSNGLIVVAYWIYPAATFYVIMLRPFGNDLETCVVPWVFYLTHPVFKHKKRNSIMFLNSGKINS